MQCSTHGKFGKGVILGKQPDTFVKMIVWRCPLEMSLASKESSPYHQKNFCFFLKPNSFLIDRISCQGTKNLASTRKKTKFLVVISLRMQVFPITTIRFKNPAKISRFVYSTHSPFNACADKCPLCSHTVVYDTRA